MLRTLPLLLLCLTAWSADEFPKRRLDIDPVLCGLWMAHASSEDGGKTIQPSEPPEAIARVSAGKLIAGDTVYRVSQVLITKNKDGDLGNLIQFENSKVVVYVGDRGESGMHLVQMFSTEGGKFSETMRWVITIE